MIDIPVEVTSLLALVQCPPTSPVEYVVGGMSLSADNRETIAQLLAEDAMVIACGKTSVLDRWRARRDGGPPETGAKLESVRTFVKIGFGLPEKPVTADHLQGFVAELLWNRLLDERVTCKDGRRLVHRHSITADPLEPGGDGLVIYSNGTAELVFRLWEVKKHDAKSRLSGTINRASKQLSRRGSEYLAKIVAAHSSTASGQMAELYDSMVDLWFDKSPRAGIGVAVGTSDKHAPSRPSTFNSLKTAFPGFSSRSQKEGIVVAVPDFPQFATRIQEIAWSGL